MQIKDGAEGYSFQAVTWPVFVVFFPAVVGVKLNVSVWMNSFMNATLKVNVSCVQRWVGSLWEKGLELWNVILSLSVFFFFLNWEQDSTLSLSRNTHTSI